MNIARIIVDVATSEINETFDYRIPEKYRDIVEPGVRVIVPFGPRKITGFVVELTSESAFCRLRDIIEVLDVTPVLTEELLQLGRTLAEETVSLYITTYQAMLPQVLKAKYKKNIVRKTNEPLPSELESLFENRNTISFADALASISSYKMLKRYVERGDIAIQYVIKRRETKKYETIFTPAKEAELQAFLKTLSKRATKQRQIVQFFLDHPQPIERKQLYDTVQITRNHLNPLLQKGIIVEHKKEVYRNPYAGTYTKTEPLRLTDEQANALKQINRSIDHDEHRTYLLHGVTGSGKTEVYLQAIERVLEKGREAIVLVPEISLTPQMVRRFKGRFGKQVAVLHSALSAGEKYDEWRKIQRKEVRVVVGARSAIFAPFENVGIIIIDEEHETTYKQSESPRYHAKDVAIKRGKYNNCPVVLGSATPTLESYARARKNVYTLLTLTKRANKQKMPTVDVIDMRKELHEGNRTMFSRALMHAIKDRLDKNEQIVLLLNRRGYSTFALCRDCGHVEQCPHCDISMTYHKTERKLKCHYCTHEAAIPTVCPTCNSTSIRFFGTGTERVEESLTKLIPEARVIRMDVDTTRRKGAHEKLLQKFQRKEADILLGTQMIAKGLDFKDVTLVGVLAADSMLHLPDFRSSERTFQLLTQVSGRAGRHALPGEVIIQTYTPEHYSIQYASEYNFEQFFAHEMNIRHRYLYPPYVYLLLLTVSHESEMKAHAATLKIARKLQQIITKNSRLLGPAPSPIARVKNRYRFQIMVKYRHEHHLHRHVQTIIQAMKQERKDDVQIIVDFNPYQLM